MASKAHMVDTLKEQIGKLEEKLSNDTRTYEKRIKSIQSVVDEKTTKIDVGKTQREEMRSVINDLRGTIKVYLRVRPFLEKDGVDLSAGAPPPSAVDFDPNNKDATLAGADGPVEFDRTFQPQAGQDEVFAEIQKFIAFAQEGYHCSVLSYGAAGTGKTHTMTGSGTGAMKGLVPRTIESLAAAQVKAQPLGWEWATEMTLFEIAQEKLKDLLVDVDSGEHDIKVDAKGRTSFTNAKKVVIDPAAIEDQIPELMGKWHQHGMSEGSGAASIFSFRLVGRSERAGAVVKGELHFIDLPGHEQMVADPETADKSLANLEEVLLCIAKRKSYVPAKAAKLTYFMMPTVVGDGKCSAFFHVSPRKEDVAVSKHLVDFAIATCKECELGKPTKHVTEKKRGTNEEEQGDGGAGGKKKRKK
jgi:kinesin family protein C1